jgi:hypothetical protein
MHDGRADPVTIQYDLAELGAPGRFEYRYRVTNVSLTPSLSWFSIDFDTALYDEGSLQITSLGLANWSQQLLASIPILGVPAQYDAYKTLGTPLGIGDTEVGFSVQFTWLGTGAPGAQVFTAYDPGNLNVLFTGVTTAANVQPPGVPEPASLALVVAAVLGAAAAGRASKQRQASTTVV